ncbi:UDP-glucose 4-epimerase GalE [Streptomyces canus]|uniref:UDP-glucose 4-epimerase GalE n=1 Tax=Streptomyces canus TaxID=58343 RepID=UPI000375B7DA|nr:UDP-glucose 4-epimerase GalE [Streptomyces canus]
MARREPVPSTVLVTGGAGFLGSHACVEFLDHGYEVVVVDNYCNSNPQALTRVERIAGRFVGAVYELDIRDRRALSAVFDRHAVDAVVHFAALKSLSGSTRRPVEYYDINVGGTTALLHTMHEHGVHRLVFSSTCSIYGRPTTVPVDESAPARPTTPYSASKWLSEQILADVCRRRPEYTVACLRHFNPAGAHPSGLLGEAPRGAPENLMPNLTQAAVGGQERLQIFGDDYPTPDGTAIRDYIHVLDSVEAHRLALDHLSDGPGMRVYNVGLGEGRSVLDLIRAFEQVSGRTVPYEIGPRRPGDVAEVVADSSAVTREWGWRPARDLADICRDAWRFQLLSPYGYAESERRPRPTDG